MDAERLYAHLDAINSQGWAELAHRHIADDGPAGELARALACAVQLAEQGSDTVTYDNTADAPDDQHQRQL